MGKRPRGLITGWKPKPYALALINLVHDRRDEWPMLVRHILYVAVSDGLTNGAGRPLVKDDNGYESVSRALTMARRAGLLAEDAIADTTNRMVAAEYTDVDGFVDAMRDDAEHYRRVRQAGQPVRIVVWCEHRGMRDILWPVCAEYGVPLILSGGFDSTTVRMAEAQIARDADVPTVVLHLGDRDTKGEEIFDVLSDDLPRLSGYRMSVVRLALTNEQIVEQELIADDGKAQMDALSTPYLRAPVNDAILDRQDADVRADVLAAESIERDHVLAMLDRL